MAIDKIEIIKNTSAVPEETLLEQFSYVTFNIDPKKFNFRNGGIYFDLMMLIFQEYFL